MESHELRVFQEVAKEGSITKAAQALGYVQSNVTARVRQLEAQLQTQLFYRQRGMVLTPAGEELLSYTERILHLLDEAEQAVNNFGEPRGRLALGANHKVAALHLPTILAKYHNQFPGVDLSLMSGQDQELLDKVRHFQLDAAFVKSSVRDENLVEKLVFEEDLVLITGPDKSNVESLDNGMFLMNSAGCVYRAQFMDWLKSEGVSNIRIMEFNQLDLILEGVAAGLGASLVPRSAIKKYEEDGLVKSLPIPKMYSSTKTFLVRHKDSLETSAFTEFVAMVEAGIGLPV